MTGIQILLIGAIIAIFAYYISRLRNALLDLIILFLLTGMGIFFILFPEYTNTIAQRLGVGRGTDLLFYISIIFFLFITIKLFSRIRRLEEKLTELIRQQAIEDVQQRIKKQHDDNLK